VDALADALPTLRDMFSGETSVGGPRCESGAFRLHLTPSRRTARLYVDSQFICQTLRNIEYLSRMFSIVQQQARDYIVFILEDVFPYVTDTLTSVTYVEPPPDASKNIEFQHLYEVLISCNSYCKV